MKSGSKWVASVCAVTLLGVGGRYLLLHNDARADKQTEEARSIVDLTIYSDDFGMVHEVRPQQVVKGNNHFHITEVSKTLDPQSVALDWKGDGDLPQTVAQVYDLGVNSESDLSKRFLGRQVELVRYGQNGREAERQKGELMVQDNGGLVLQSAGNLYINPTGTLVAPASSDIVTIPQLSVQADSPSSRKVDLDMTYLTRGISWSADYVATLSPKDDNASIECWATVLNKTGVNYPGAHISLVTGSPNRAAAPPGKFEFKDGGRAAAFDLEEAPKTLHKGGSSFGAGRISAQISVGEFHAYPVTMRTSVIQDQMNRVLMFSSKSVAVIKDYNTRPPDISAYDDEYNWQQSRVANRGAVAFSMTFFNTARNGLGTPLPHGNIRLYEPGGDGASAYVGAASVIDTPENERVDLTPGNAFDLFTEWRTVKRERAGKHLIKKTVELKLHNEKAVDVKLRVVQGFAGSWKMVSEPEKHSNLSSSEIQWIAPVKAHTTRSYIFTVLLRD